MAVCAYGNGYVKSNGTGSTCLGGIGRACFSGNEATFRNRYSNRCGGIANDGGCLLGKSGNRIRRGLSLFLEEACPSCGNQLIFANLRGILIGQTVIQNGGNGRGALYAIHSLTVLRDGYGIGIGTGSTGGVSGCSGDGGGISYFIDRQLYIGYQLGKLGMDVIAYAFLRSTTFLAYGDSGSGINDRLGVFQSGDVGILGYGYTNRIGGNGSDLVAVCVIIRIGNNYVVVCVAGHVGSDGTSGIRARRFTAYVAVRGILIPRIGQRTAIGNGSNHAQSSGSITQIEIGINGRLSDYRSSRMYGGKTGNAGITREGDDRQVIQSLFISVRITVAFTIVHHDDITLVQRISLGGCNITDGFRFQFSTGKNGKAEGHNSSQLRIGNGLFPFLGRAQTDIQGFAVRAERNVRNRLRECPNIKFFSRYRIFNRIFEFIEQIVVERHRGFAALNVYNIENGISVYGVMYPRKLIQIHSNPGTLHATQAGTLQLIIHLHGVTRLTVGIVPLTVQIIDSKICLEVLGHCCGNHHRDASQKQSQRQHDRK